MSSNKSKNFSSYQKHVEHQDRTSLAKLKSKYWTTKQLVIKKLGREEDEFVIASDADVDAKLELLQAVKRSCNDLSRIIESYETNVLILSHEDTDLARFLKDYAQVDRTRAGKIMASVSKVLAFTAQQRLTLRQALLRLHNENETFRHRAVTDTFSTVRRMENARTEYRGSILWLKDASVQLDPEKQLEKFRRVQSQVKSNKIEYDRLKSDVIQKIDLLIASRCNMYSHVLATYQKALLSFWARTAKTMGAVVEAFKGYQYYEFTVIKDLVEPSRLLAETNSSSFSDKPIDRTKKSKGEILEEKLTTDQKQQNDPVELLIDISDSQLDEQLLELEQLTTIDDSKSKFEQKTTNVKENLVELSQNQIDDEKTFDDFLCSSKDSINSQNLDENSTKNFENVWNDFLGEEKKPNENVLPTETNSFLPSSLLSEYLTSTNKNNSTISPSKVENKRDWLSLFAELDPLQNPDAIGKSATIEEDRSC